tara:strand:+ start:17962 stop:18264 length:303 start_codon:yes stop_codon:yes gene_type:complete
MFTYAVTQKTIDKIRKNKNIEELRLLDYNTDYALIPSQNWADVRQISPPIEYLYFERDDTLPVNHTILHRNGASRRGIFYVVVSEKIAHYHGISLNGLGV